MCSSDLEGQFTLTTPIDANFETIHFDFTPQAGTSRKYFEEVKEESGNINIIVVPSKRPTTSLSEDPASQYKMDDDTESIKDTTHAKVFRSKSVFFKTDSNKMISPQYIKRQPVLDENKPFSLNRIDHIDLQNKRKPKKMSKWQVENHLIRASETDSMNVSTNVIRIEEPDYRLVGLNVDLVKVEHDNPQSLELQIQTVQKRTTKCPIPRSLEGSQRNLQIENQQQVEEELEDPFSGEEEGQEDMEHSIPDSFDE